MTAFNEVFKYPYIDICLYKIDKNGKIVWERCLWGENNDEGNWLIPTKNDEFIIIGSANSFGKGDYNLYLLKIDKNGYPLWQK